MGIWLRRAGVGLGALVVLLLLAAGAVYAMSSARLGATATAEAHAFDAASGDAVEGGRLAGLYGCTDCHGEDLAGKVMIDEMPFARVAAPNLTSGRSGGALTDVQWELAVRHGVGTDGRALFIMPSPEYVYLSDRDLADIVAHVRTLPAVSDDLPPRAFGPVGRVLVTLGKLPLTTDLMPPDAAHPAAVAKEPTADFGRYLTRLCTGCHGPDLGGAPPGPPGAPAGPSLAGDGNLRNWTLEQFAAALRTGRTPEGKQLDPQFMPWTAVGKASDAEIEAMWTYLSSLR